MDELCDSMYWVDLNAYDDNVDNDDMNIDEIQEESNILKDTNDMYIVTKDE